MTISSTTRINGPYISGTALPVTFKVFTAADLQVIRLNTSTGTETTLVLNSDYTVTLNGDQNTNPGGTVTLVVAASATSTVTITSDIANLQPTDLTNQGGFYPEVITDSLDRATIQIQQIADIGDRTLKIPISDGTLNMELPTKTERANSFLSFDANGLPSVVTAGSSGAPATITRQVFSGTGSQTAFTLASDPGALGNSAQVYIGGVYQQRSTYTIAGTTLTFSQAPVAGTNNIEFVNFLTSNIGATSADLVTYTPSGSGAVARSAASKFGETVSVKDFGAVGDGVTDDKAAFIAATSALRAAGGGTLYIPSTANGYYLGYGAGEAIDVSGMSNVAIVSDGATLKLQGGPLSVTTTAPVIGGFGSTLTSNIIIKGLRFVAASTVLRYGNGAIGAGFDTEVNAGRADPLEQTCFRHGILFDGYLKNIEISDCYFGTGFYYSISIKNNSTADLIYGVRLSNLMFEGVNQQCIYLENNDGTVISDITCLNKLGCLFDWLFYIDGSNSNVTVMNVSAVNATFPPVGLGSSCILVGGTNHRIVGANLTNWKNPPVYVEGIRTQIFDCCFFDCEECLRVAVGGALDCNVISDCVFDTATTGILFTGGLLGSLKSARIDNCVFRNIDGRAVYSAISNTSSLAISDCTIVDCGNTLSCFRTDDNASVRNVKFNNLTVKYQSFVPTFRTFDIRGSSTVVSIDGCSFDSEFGTCSLEPIFATASAIVRVNDCRLSGYSVPLSITSPASVLAYATTIPGAETQLTANSATPSVLGTVRFVTANSNPTAITNFTDGVEGQQITVRVNDANTTFDFSGTNLKGNNGVDYAATSGDLLFATKIGSNWYCTICEA
jgi:hypothetical protein